MSRSLYCQLGRAAAFIFDEKEVVKIFDYDSLTFLMEGFLL
ncbi:hypothetical protein [Acidianus infernus]|nr:hypothetical protein [Acidianus infernus]